MSGEKNEGNGAEQVAKSQDEDDASDMKGWAAILNSIRSPLSLFALTVLICNAIVSFAAANLNSLTAFVYSMHLFLGIVGTFTIIALWSPRTLYNPIAILGIDLTLSKEEKFRNTGITVLILFLLVGYIVREYYKVYHKNAAITQIVKTIKSDLIKDNSSFTIECDKQNKADDKMVSEITCRLRYTKISDI